jgi:hypothetical protein
MPNRWLQIKGDPSVRAFLFQQSRVESGFDLDIDGINRIVYALLTTKGAFHVKIHFSSSQLTCWFADDAFRYRVFVMEEVLQEDFLDQFRDCKIDHLQPLIDEEHTWAILSELKQLRTTDETVYLRNGSINRVNGMIGMTFSCDGAHYIDHKTFFEKIESFGSGEAANSVPILANAV